MLWINVGMLQNAKHLLISVAYTIVVGKTGFKYWTGTIMTFCKVWVPWKGQQAGANHSGLTSQVVYWEQLPLWEGFCTAADTVVSAEDSVPSIDEIWPCWCAKINHLFLKKLLALEAGLRKCLKTAAAPGRAPVTVMSTVFITQVIFQSSKQVLIPSLLWLLLSKTFHAFKN